MKNRFPSEKEWEKLVEDAFLSDEEHIFSDSYNRRRSAMKHGITMTKKRDTRRGITAAAAVIAAAAVLIPSSVIAYNKLTAKVEKTGEYRTTIDIKAPAETVSEGFKYYDYTIIPEGFGYGEMNNFRGYWRETTGDKLKAAFFCIPEGKEVNIDLLFSGDYETYAADGKTAFISRRLSYDEGNSNNYGRDVFVCFDDTPYFMELLPTDGISDEELKMFIEGLALIDTEEQRYGTYIPWLDKDNTDIIPEKIQTIDPEKANILAVGDTASYPRKFEGDLMGYDVTVNSVEVTDSFEGITTDSSGEYKDYSGMTNENGDIAQNFRIYMTTGDGINTLDEVVCEEEMPLRILKVKATYTNTTDTEDTFIICPDIMMIDGNVIDTRLINEFTDEHGADSFYNSLLGRYRDKTLPFSLEIPPEVKGDKNRVILPPGESAEVELRFFVTDDFLDRLYLNFVTYGNTYESSINSGYPIFDIRQ